MSDAIFVATPAPDLTYSKTRSSHWKLQLPAGSQHWEMSGRRSEYARTYAIHHFLKETDLQYILLLDSDQDPPPDAAVRLLEHRKEIVSALYLYRGRPAYPVIREDYDPHDIEVWPSEPFFNFPRDALFKVGTTGFGFLLMHRSAFEKMVPLFHAMGRLVGLNGPLNWAYYGAWRGVMSGADLIFCDVAKLAGLDIWCDSSVFIPHLAPEAIALGDYDAKVAKESRPL